MSHALLSLVLLSLFASAAPAATDSESEQAWVDFELENGIQVSMLYAPLAPQQALFTLLPLGLLDDAAERTQYAHLIEHLMIRTTDPVELQVGDLLLNGETTALALRLETFSNPEPWLEALERHAKWLQADHVEAEVLAREQLVIEQEEQQTAETGYTHKWAMAAWNQVVRHGATHVALHGDVAQATTERSLEYLRDRLRVGPGVRFVSVGPVTLDEVRPAIEAALSGIEGESWAVSVPSVSPEVVRGVKDHQATWDLPRRHYIEWFPVPDRSALDRVSADALALLLNIKMQQRGGLRASGVLATAAADLVSPEGRWIAISASLPLGVDPSLVQKEMATVKATLGDGGEAGSVVMQLTMQLTEMPDFAQVRDQMVGAPGLKWIEAQQALFMLYAQLNMGLALDELREAYAELTAADLVTFGEAVLRDGQRSTLMLEPAD